MISILLRWAWTIPLYFYLQLATTQTSCIASDTMCSFPHMQWRDRMATAFVTLVLAAVVTEVVGKYRRGRD
ncbi:hypothetical protein [Sphingomonas koreensis]